MKINQMGRLAVLAWGMSAIACFAIDYGAPIYRDNVNSMVQVEAIYNRFNRDVKVGSVERGMDQNIGMIRFQIPGDKATTYLNAGFLDDNTQDGGTPMLAGGGVFIEAYDSDYARVNLLVSGQYVPEYDIKSSDYFKGNMKYYEVGGGVLFSGKLSDELDDWQFVPYAGMMYSILRGTENVTIDPPANGRSRLSYDVKEKNVLVGVVGLSVIALERFSFRVEGDLIGDQSFSLALGIAF